MILFPCPSAFVLLLLLLVTPAKPVEYACFPDDKDLLHQAVLEYIHPEAFPDSEVLQTYGPVIGNWCVRQVTDFSYVFFTFSTFNEPLQNWDVSKATSMEGMFTYASSFNKSLNKWNVSSVTNMNGMFRDAISFNRPLNNWDVSSVMNMVGMFTAALSFNQPLNSWDVSSVLNMDAMFGLASAFNQSLHDWNVSSVNSMSYMFHDATKFKQNLCSWGKIMKRDCDVLGMFDNAASCLIQTDPVLAASPPGPFCAPCSCLNLNARCIYDTNKNVCCGGKQLVCRDLPPHNFKCRGCVAHSNICRKSYECCSKICRAPRGKTTKYCA